MFPFDRLLEKIDKLIFEHVIEEEVFAQIGYCNYEPKYYKYQRFLNRDEFSDQIKKATMVITHAGTGAIMGGVKLRKRVIAVPRLRKYDEHVDDHQVQIVKELGEMNLIEPCFELEELGEVIRKCYGTEYEKYNSNTSKIVASLKGFIEG